MREFRGFSATVHWCFNALSRDTVNDDLHHFTAHELNGVYQSQ